MPAPLKIFKLHNNHYNVKKKFLTDLVGIDNPSVYCRCEGGF